jgi:ketosteroid isomerase-like protein
MSQPMIDVLNHHLTCLGRGDLDGLMDDYTEASVMFTPDGVLEGRSRIREFQSNLLKMLPAGTSFTTLRQDLRGDTVFLIWRAESPSVRFHIGSDTMVIRERKIVVHSFVAAVEQKD